MTFKNKGYQVIREFLEPEFVEFIQQYFFVRIKSGSAMLGDIQAPNSYGFYSDPLTETILENSCDKLSEMIGVNLLPTYSFTRLYGKNDELKKHKDRPSCEISATLSLGLPENTNPSPLFFSKSGEEKDCEVVMLNPGDLCLYRGCDIWHWREKFSHKWYLQTFLHYVDADGPYKNWIYDKRPYLAMPLNARCE